MPIQPAAPPPPLDYRPPMEPYLTVLYEDGDILALAKPSGLLSVPGKNEIHADCLERRAQEQFPGATIVHRLDHATSGVMVMARCKAAHRHLSLQFERRHLKKVYIARVWGNVEKMNGRIDLPLICDWPNRPLQHVDYERGKPAQTDWEVIAREGQDGNGADAAGAAGTEDGTEDGDGAYCGSNRQPVTRLKLMPLTGRSHQLRVHMRELGHPILGDRFYASGPALAAADRLQLHAFSLTLYHPADGRVITFTDPCPF